MRCRSFQIRASGEMGATKSPALRVRLAIRSDRWFKRAMSGIRALHHGLWLGLFRVEDIADANALAYKQWDRYQSEDYNRSGLTDWERDAIVQHFPAGSTIVVASAGGGREVFGLEQLGHDAVGFDPSPELVEHGNRLIEAAGSGAELVLSAPDQVPANLEGPFHAVVFGWGGYVHIRGRDTRVAFLRHLRELIDRDAPLLLSFFLRSAGDRSFPVTQRLALIVQGLRRSREPIELGDTVEGTFDHYFTWDEIESEVTSAGFEIIESSSAPYPHVVCRAV
jgi:hypothetical protein